MEEHISNYTCYKNYGKIEALHPKKLKRTIQDVYAHARILHVALYGCIIISPQYGVTFKSNQHYFPLIISLI